MANFWIPQRFGAHLPLPFFLTSAPCPPYPFPPWLLPPMRLGTPPFPFQILVPLRSPLSGSTIPNPSFRSPLGHEGFEEGSRFLSPRRLFFPSLPSCGRPSLSHSPWPSTKSFIECPRVLCYVFPLPLEPCVRPFFTPSKFTPPTIFQKGPNSSGLPARRFPTLLPALSPALFFPRCHPGFPKKVPGLRRDSWLPPLHNDMNLICDHTLAPVSLPRGRPFF